MMTSCAPDRHQRVNKPYHPMIGDHATVVLGRLASPYFGYRGPTVGTIEGYLYDPGESRYCGFGSGMIDENKRGLKVVLLYYVDDVIRDIITVDGGVTGALLDGTARDLFIEKWKRGPPVGLAVQSGKGSSRKGSHLEK